MDGDRFDRLAMTLGGSTGRRGFLKGVVGALLGGATAAKVAADGEAACSSFGGPCSPQSQCCTGLTCAGGHCKCGAGQEKCAGPGGVTCVAACPPGQYMGSGCRCLCKATGRPPGPNGCSCTPGTTPCGGQCLTCPPGQYVNPATCQCTCRDGGLACGANCCQRTTCMAATCEGGHCGLVVDQSAVGKLCTATGDPTATCQPDGSCKTTPQDCSPQDTACTEYAWNPTTRTCEAHPRPNGTTCPNPSDPCQTGTCDGEGVCRNFVPKTNGTSCGASGQTCCDGQCLPSGQTCTPICPPQQVCGSSCLTEGQVCCGGATPCASGQCCDGTCLPQGQTCGSCPGGMCGGQCLQSGQECCNGSPCAAGQCCRGVCLSAGEGCAPIECPTGQVPCGDTCRREDQICCQGTTPCEPGGCCADGCASLAEVCCGASSCPFEFCCGGRCLQMGEQCCGGQPCPSGQCCDGQCLAPGQTCGPSCPPAQQCGSQCLTSGQTCCGGTTPCAPDRCCNGTCLAAGETCCQNPCGHLCLDGTGASCCRGGGVEEACESGGFCCSGIDLCLHSWQTDTHVCCPDGICQGVCCPNGGCAQFIEACGF